MPPNTPGVVSCRISKLYGSLQHWLLTPYHTIFFTCLFLKDKQRFLPLRSDLNMTDDEVFRDIVPDNRANTSARYYAYLDDIGFQFYDPDHEKA